MALSRKQGGGASSDNVPAIVEHAQGQCHHLQSQHRCQNGRSLPLDGWPLTLAHWTLRRRRLWLYRARQAQQELQTAKFTT